MRPIIVIKTNVLVHEAFHVTFIENDHMIVQVPTAVANPPFRNTILPRTSKRCPFGPDAKALHGFDHFFIELSAPVKDQVAGRRIIRECPAQLLNDAGAGRMFGNIVVQDAPPVWAMTKKQ